MSYKRSYLFVPSSSLTLMEKAMNSNADAVIFDLEDGVAISEKVMARERVKQYASNHRLKKNIYVRVNEFLSPFWQEDIKAAIESGVCGLVIPKAESPYVIQKICDEVRRYVKQINRDREELFEVIPLIETANGVHFAYEIAKSHCSVKRLIFGSIDYSLDINCQLSETGEELLFARSQVVNASRAAGIESPIDAVYSNLSNEEGLKNEAYRARRLGFTSKLAIHPKQVDAIHIAFTPTLDELKEAREIVEAFKVAEEKGIAAISVGDKLVDYPVFQKAKQLIESAEF